MWYILIIAGILVTMTAYIKWKTASRRRRRIDGGRVDRLLANEPAVFFAAALTLLFIALSILLSQPGLSELRPQRLQRETAWRQLVALQLATELAANLEGEGKVLLIDRQPLADSAAYHEAIKAGLQAGFGGKAEIAAEAYWTPPENVTEEDLPTLESMLPTNAQFSSWLSEHQDCNIVISFIGVPSDYAQSMMSYRAQSGDLQVGVYTGNVYQLGYPISSKGIQACVVPKHSYIKEDMAPDLKQPQVSFDNRYLMITPANVKDIYSANRRMFKVQRAIY